MPRRTKRPMRPAPRSKRRRFLDPDDRRTADPETDVTAEDEHHDERGADKGTADEDREAPWQERVTDHGSGPEQIG